MMGVQAASAQLFYDFCLDDHVPSDHMLRGIERHLELDDLRQSLKPFYSQIGRPSVDPELMIRMLIVGYCIGHLKQILRLTRLRLRGPNGASDEFLLAATAQNLERLARLRPTNMLPEMLAA